MKLTAVRPGGDVIEFTILDDGSLKIETDGISMPNHGNAELLIRQVLLEMGGEASRVRKVAHHHQHHHEHKRKEG